VSAGALIDHLAPIKHPEQQSSLPINHLCQLSDRRSAN
jgi:hypothetical protein